METNKNEILQKLAEMKKEMTLKLRKLEKSKRASLVKTHVRQRIQEQNTVKASASIQSSKNSHSDCHDNSCSEITMSSFGDEGTQLQEPRGCELPFISRDNITLLESTLQDSSSSVHSALADPCFKSLDIEHKTTTQKPDTVCSVSHNNVKEGYSFLSNGGISLKANLPTKQAILNQTKPVVVKKSRKRKIKEFPGRVAEGLESYTITDTQTRCEILGVHTSTDLQAKCEIPGEHTSTSRHTKCRINNVPKQAFINTVTEGNCETGHDRINSCDKIKQRGEDHIETTAEMISFSISALDIAAGNCGDLNLRSKTKSVSPNKNKQEPICNVNLINLNSKTTSVLPKTLKLASLCNYDDFMRCNKIETFCKSGKDDRTGSKKQHTSKKLGLNKDWQSLRKAKVGILSDITVDNQLVLNHRGVVRLSGEDRSVRSRSACERSESVIHENSLYHDHKSLSGNESECGIKLSKLVSDKCSEEKDILNKGLTSNVITSCQPSCDSGIVNNRPMFIIDHGTEKKVCTKTKMSTDMECCENIQSLTENGLSGIDKTHYLEDVAATSHCHTSSAQLASYTNAASNIHTTSEHGRNSCLFLSDTSQLHSLVTDIEKAHNIPLKNTDISRTNKSDQSCKNQKESSMSNDSDEDIVKGSQVSMVDFIPHLCGRRQSLPVNNDFSQNALTPSFESLSGPLSNKSVLDNITVSICEQEQVTDSQFLNILGLTQTDSEVVKRTGTQAGHRSTSINCKTLHQTGKHVGESQISNSSHNMSSAVTVSVGTPLSDCLQLGSSCKQNNSPMKENRSEFSAGVSENRPCIHTVPAIDAFNSKDPFLDYTELDVIPYSQFELTEDFLSETQQSQESMYRSTRRAKSSGALVKRRSSRISSSCFNHSNSGSLSAGSLLLSQQGSQLANVDCTVGQVKLKHRMSLVEGKKAAAVLSVFQFLIDDAKRTSPPLEFELPELFDSLKVNRVESVAELPYFCEGQFCVENEQDNIEIQGGCIKNTNNILDYDSFSFVEDVGTELSSANTKYNRMQQSIDVGNSKDVEEQPEANSVQVNDVQNVICHSDTTGDLSQKKLQANSAEDLEIHSAILRHEKITSEEAVREYLLEINTTNLSCNVAGVKSSNCLQANRHAVHKSGNDVTPFRRVNRHVSKLGMKLAHPKFGKTVVKKLFAAKNAGVYAGLQELNANTIGKKEIVTSVESASHVNISQRSRLIDEAMSGAFSSQQSRFTGCTVGCAVVLQSRTPSPRLGRSLTVFETPETPNTLCLHARYDSFHAKVTTPDQLLQPFRNSISLLATTPDQPNVRSAQTPNISADLGSPEPNASFLHSPNPVTSVFETTCHMSSSQKSRGSFTLTSTPKTPTTSRTMCAISRPDSSISFNDWDTGHLNKSSVQVSVEGAESDGLEHHCPQPNPPSCLSKLAHSNISSVSSDQMLYPDESYLSPAQIPVNVSDLPTVIEPSSDVLGTSLDYLYISLDALCTSSAAKRSDVTHNNGTELVTTSSNVISPWKKVTKTASTPVLVVEERDLRKHLGTPVFSPILRRSRPKSSSNKEIKSDHLWRFSGCFQCCAQDAVVSILSGVLRTRENEVKHYIISVQASSLTVWTEDDLGGWTAELDWRLTSDIHVMKACLLPRTDSVVAVVASGWDKRSLFATLFVYDWSTEDTTRFNIPLMELQNELLSPSQIELCPVRSSDLHITMTSDTQHTVGSVHLTDSLKAVQSLSVFGAHRGKLINFVVLEGQASASVSLTADQEVSIWNMKLGVVLKRIKLQSSLPCLTGLLAATSDKGILLLDTVWRVDDGDCGGVIAVNPLTGQAQRIWRFSVPNNTWRSIETAKSEKNIVTAISDKGSLGIWNRQGGALVGCTRSKITTCASLMTLTKHLVVGEIHGCLHIYSAPS